MSLIYDSIYTASKEYRKHYKESVYYGVWSEALRNISGKVLDIGCGVGQFGVMLRDNGITDYRGIDISKVAVGMAQTKGLDCICGDVFESDIMETDYDTIVMMEVLEHIEKDIELLRKVKPGKKIVFSVPDFWSRTHVRVYPTAEFIRQRYNWLKLEIKEVKILTSTIFVCSQ